MQTEDDFDITQYTSATLRMDARIQYRDKSAAEVFEIMGDPQCITDCCPLFTSEAADE